MSVSESSLKSEYLTKNSQLICLTAQRYLYFWNVSRFNYSVTRPIRIWQSDWLFPSIIQQEQILFRPFPCLHNPLISKFCPWGNNTDQGCSTQSELISPVEMNPSDAQFQFRFRVMLAARHNPFLLRYPAWGAKNSSAQQVSSRGETNSSTPRSVFSWGE